MAKNVIMGVLVIGLVLVTLVLAFSSKTTTVISQGADLRNTISVTGQSELSVQPDQAELYIRVRTNATTAKAAKDENADLTNDVMSALLKAGIKKEDIESYQFSIYPDQRWNEKEMIYETYGYVCDHILKVTTKDTENAGDYIDTAVNAGANGIDRVEFTLSKEYEKDVKNQVMIKASDDAKEKAEALTSNLGVNLGKITSISESNFVYSPYVYYGAERAMSDAGGAYEEKTSIQPQKVEVQGY